MHMRPLIRCFFASHTLHTLFFVLVYAGMDSLVFGMQAPTEQPPKAHHHQSWNLIVFNTDVSVKNSLGAIEIELLQALSAHHAPIIVRKSAVTSALLNLLHMNEGARSPIPKQNRISIIFDDWHLFNTDKEDYCVLIPSPANTSATQMARHAREIGLAVDENDYGGQLTPALFQNNAPFRCNVYTAKNVITKVMRSSHHHRWNVYLMGHGLPGIIAHFPTDEFRELLIFLTTRNLNALVYGTCFGAGENLKQPYSNKNHPLRLNYAIACQCARFASSLASRTIDFEQLFHELSNRAAYQSWDECFQAALRENEQRHGSCAFMDVTFGTHMALNFPWIRDPNAETFHLLSLPLYNAQPYTAADDRVKERPINLTPRLHTLLVQTPCVNRPIRSQNFPAVISVADRPYHYLRSFTHGRLGIDTFPFSVFETSGSQDEPPTYLLGECRCVHNDRLYRYSNVRIQNSPIGFWPKLFHYIKYGKNAERPTLSKIITAECEDGQIIQSVTNQKFVCYYDSRNIMQCVNATFALICLGISCRLQSKLEVGILSSATKVLEKICYGSAAVLPISLWLRSAHVDLATGNIIWPAATTWKVLSPAEAQNYRNEFSRQHRELAHLAKHQRRESKE